MEHVSRELTWVLAGILVVYFALMYFIGYMAQRRIYDVEDYLLAGRKLSIGLASMTIIATWFGAESLMTTTDEVSQRGIRRALMDPIGISICLVIASLFVAGPLWRMKVLTIPDFFSQHYGKSAELLSAMILAPSYLGWVAAQFVALATVFHQFTGVDFTLAVIAIALLGTGYAIMGGMWSITWTDAAQMVFIVVGLLVLGYEILVRLGSGNISVGIQVLRDGPPESHWSIADRETFQADVLLAVSALSIGALGNLPVQDLLQRIQSAKSARVARQACLIASGGYLAMGLIPIGAGLAAAMLLPRVPDQGVLTAIAQQILSPSLLILFVLAIVSAVLSTIVSAVMAPAAIVAHNLVQPLVARFAGPLSTQSQLALQRSAVIVITAISVLLALSGARAYELVQGSYAMSLVGLCVPFLAGIYLSKPPAAAAIAAIVTGTTFWGLHIFFGWDDFLQPWVNSSLRIPHELIDTALSAGAFMVVTVGCRCRCGPPSAENDRARVERQS